GFEVPEVAERLTITENSVKEYLKRIRVKYTNVNRPAASKLDLFRRAIEDGIVPPVEPHQ
ncbi:MAG: DNA-binding response regulator, partial [Actinobacteria bacterium]|nr:DNA-binding response regulator [Actinomycetota bacterium]